MAGLHVVNMPIDRDTYFSVYNLKRNFIYDPFYQSFLKHRSKDLSLDETVLTILGLSRDDNPKIVTFCLPVIFYNNVIDLGEALLKSCIVKTSILNIMSILESPIGGPNKLNVTFYIPNRETLEVICSHILNLYTVSTIMYQRSYTFKAVEVYVQTQDQICEKKLKL